MSFRMARRLYRADWKKERLLRHMAAMHVLEEVKEDTYAPTTFSIALGTPGYAHCMQHL